MAKWFLVICVKHIKAGVCGAVFCIFCMTFAGCTKEETDVTGILMEASDISAFVGVLQKKPNGVLANRNGKKLRTQIVTFQFSEDNRVYFCTNNAKPMYKQLQQYPYVSYCQYAEDFEPVILVTGYLLN